MTDPASLIFGKYELIRRLALGGMGEVFLARQTGGVSGTERLVILKSLLPELAEQDGFVDQFLDEARVAAKLNHPNIVQMYEAGLWNGMYFIAMEYIRGDNLSRIQKVARARGVAPPIHLMVRIARDALLGLGHAHTAIDEMTGKPLQVVHRDVSPQNIMVRIDGVTKLVDFGIAKAANKLDRTKTGVLKGKLQFMSPEQVMGEDVDARTDQFAMGVVLWEMLTGTRLFQGDNEIQILRAVSQQPIPSPSSVVPGFPPDLEMVVMRMLERDRTRRYASCAEAAEELAAWLAQGSRRVSEADVAVFVKQIVGDSVDEATRNVSASENFLLSLHHTPSKAPKKPVIGQQPETSPTMVRRLEAKKSRTMAGIGVGIGVAAALSLAAAMVVMTRPDDEPARAPGGTPVMALTTMTGAGAVTGPATTTTTGAPAFRPPPAMARHVAGLLEITLSEPKNASILVDGGAWPERTPTVLRLPVGPHTVEVIDEGGRRAAVPVELPKPVVVIESEPPGASITAGGSSFGITPSRLEGKLEGGVTHLLTVSLRGHVTKEIVVEGLQDGDERTIVVKLDKVGRSPPTANSGKQTATTTTAAGGVARLTVNIVPAAKVFLDGDLVGTTPLVMSKVPAGKHSLMLESTTTGQKKTVAVVLVDGDNKKLPLTW
jgi:serine/threonine protein kinase